MQHPSGPPPSQQPYLPPSPAVYANQPPQKKSGLSCGVIALIVAAVSVPMLCVMVALAIYGVRRYIANAKTSEAKNSVSAIARGAQAAFERKREMAQSESDASSGIDALCDSAEPVPTAVPAGTKYVSVGSDWSSDDSDRGWQCLRFVMASPQYYQYQYNRGGGYVGNDLKGKEGYEAAAIGDLDADGTTSLYATGAELRGSNLRPMTLLEIRDEFE